MEGSRRCRRRDRGRLIWQQITIKKQSDFAKRKHRPIPQDAVISFVEELEKADQYFDFKRYLADFDEINSKCYIPDSLRDNIVDKLKDDSRFEKLDQEDIDHAVDCLNGVLQFNRFSGLQYIRDEGPTDWAITTCHLVLSKDVDKATGDGVYPLFGLVEVLDEFVRSNPIFTLVLQTRNKSHCLDPKPEVELLKLKKTYPFYYHGVIAKEHTYKAKTVTFTYEAWDTSVEYIKSLLSTRWKIFYVCINRLDTHLEMVHVTFKDLTEANEALCLAAQGEVKIAIAGQLQPVGVVPTIHNKPPSSCKFPHVTPEHVEAAMTGVQKVEDALFADAMNTYRKLTEKGNWGRSASTLPGQAESGQKGTELPDGVSVSDISPSHSLQSLTATEPAHRAAAVTYSRVEVMVQRTGAAARPSIRLFHSWLCIMPWQLFKKC